MTLTRSKIISSIQENTDLSKNRSTKIFESIVGIIKASLESGEDVLISGFGKFCVKKKNPRRGRNPQTGEDLLLGARRVVTFRCSEVLRDKINH